MLQEVACISLLNLSGYIDNKLTIASMGGVGAILTVMKRHGGDLAVQEAGCWALRNLTTPHNPKIQSIIEAGGGRNVVQRAIEMHNLGYIIDARTFPPSSLCRRLFLIMFGTRDWQPF